MNNSLLKRIEQLERLIIPLPGVQILRVVLPEPGERIVGIEPAPELGVPALDRMSDESAEAFECRWQSLVRWHEGVTRGIVTLRGAP